MQLSVEIETGKEFVARNLASFRKKMKQSEIPLEANTFVQHLFGTGAKKVGPMITATFSTEEINGEPYIDIEFLIPLDRKVPLHPEYQWKSILHIVNALYSRHQGDSSLLGNTYRELAAFIQKNNLHQITVAYNVNVGDEESKPAENQKIDIYIGINPCIL